MFYVCDPRKNRKCKKGSCYLNGGNCKITSDPESSYSGKPLIGAAGSLDNHPGQAKIKDEWEIGKYEICNLKHRS